MSDQEPDKGDAALQARLAKLNDALRARDERAAAQTPTRTAAKGNSFGRAMSAGLNVFSEFVAAIVVGAFVGWQADAWLGTKPWLMVVQFRLLATVMQASAPCCARLSGRDAGLRPRSSARLSILRLAHCPVS